MRSGEYSAETQVAPLPMLRSSDLDATVAAVNAAGGTIVDIVDVGDDQGETRIWFAGPYDNRRAKQTAGILESAAEANTLRDRRCYLEPLWSDDDCLRVTYYGRAKGSLY